MASPASQPGTDAAQTAAAVVPDPPDIARWENEGGRIAPPPTVRTVGHATRRLEDFLDRRRREPTAPPPAGP